MRGLFECVASIYNVLLVKDQAASVAEYNRAGGTVDEDEDDTNDDDAGNDANDANDAKSEKMARNFERSIARADWAAAHPSGSDPTAPEFPPFPPGFAFTSAMVLDAMRRLAADLDPDLPLDSLTPNLVGRLLRQLRLQPHRTASLRAWSCTNARLARLARAYGVPIPPGLAKHFASAAEPPSATPTP